jgi:hypothetical protein
MMEHRDTVDYNPHKKLWEISWNMREQRNGELQNPESPRITQRACTIGHPYHQRICRCIITLHQGLMLVLSP